MTFRLNARYVLITYPQCGELDEWAVSNHLSSLGAECIIGRENHSAGGTHLHAFCDFGKKFRSRRTDIFDVDGHHPNIEPSRGSPERGYDYAIKDGNVVAGGLARPSESRTMSSGDKWGQIVGAESESEFWGLVEQLDPKALATNFGNLKKFVDWRFKPEPSEYIDPGLSFEYGDLYELPAWRDANLGQTVSGESCPSCLTRHGPLVPSGPAPGGGPRASVGTRGRYFLIGIQGVDVNLWSFTDLVEWERPRGQDHLAPTLTSWVS